MANTNPKDFLTFSDIIPKEISQNIWIVPIRTNAKLPDVPKGTVLKGNMAYRLTPSEAYARLKNGSNIGLYAIPRGLMFIDLDVKDGKILASPGLISQLDWMQTTKIQTRNGGFQYYFLNTQKYDTQLLKENGIVIGELRNNWSYVVGIGSYVDTDAHNQGGDGTYRLISALAPAEFSGLNILDLDNNAHNKVKPKLKTSYKHDADFKFSDGEYTEMMLCRNRRVIR
jgi:hypothetical protein